MGSSTFAASGARGSCVYGNGDDVSLNEQREEVLCLGPEERLRGSDPVCPHKGTTALAGCQTTARMHSRLFLGLLWFSFRRLPGRAEPLCAKIHRQIHNVSLVSGLVDAQGHPNPEVNGA